MWMIFQKTSGACMSNIEDPDIFARGELPSSARHQTDKVSYPAEHIFGSVVQRCSGILVEHW